MLETAIKHFPLPDTNSCGIAQAYSIKQIVDGGFKKLGVRESSFRNAFNLRYRQSNHVPRASSDNAAHHLREPIHKKER